MLRLLRRALRSLTVAWGSSAARGSRGIQATAPVRECPVPKMESRRLGAEAAAEGESGGSGELSSETSPLQGQTDGSHRVERKKQQRNKRKKESCSLEDSTRCLMMEMPFAKADIKTEFSDNCSLKSNGKKRKKPTGTKNEGENLEKKKQKKQDRPNYFISLPITNPKDGTEVRRELSITSHLCSITFLSHHHSSCLPRYCAGIPV